MAGNKQGTGHVLSNG